MKHWIWLILAVMLSLAAGTAADNTEYLQPGDWSDDISRALIRLEELGYASEPSHGSYDAYGQECLYAFLRENRLNCQTIPAELFQPDAKAAPWEAEGEKESGNALHLTGAPMGWYTAQALLERETVHRVTFCDSGIVLQFRYLGGDGYARMAPSELWDSAMIETLFPGEEAFRNRPVIVLLDGIGVGACFAEVPSGTEDREFMLYFTGSYTDIARLPDVNLDDIVQTACGQDA